MTNIPFFLSADNNYAPFVATAMASVLDNTTSFIEFYVLDGGLSKENKAKITSLKNNFSHFSVEFLKIDFDKYFKDFNETERITKSMYSRFLIPHQKPEIKKALYSDVDVICMGDIREMFDESLDGYALGAVHETYAEGKNNTQKKARTNISDEHKYFSSGNLLIDCEKWREGNIFEELIKINKAYSQNLLEPDMDILNKYFDNNYKILPSKYCWINQNYEYFGKPTEPIVIRHFNGPVKPWQISPDVSENPKLSFTLDKNKFWHYAQITPFYNMLIQQTKYKTNLDLQKFLVLKFMEKRFDGT